MKENTKGDVEMEENSQGDNNRNLITILITLVLPCTSFLLQQRWPIHRL